MKKIKKYTFRKLMNDLHLWLGIASAIVLFVVCITGTLYTFRSEIERLIEPDKYRMSQVTGEVADLNELQAVVEKVSNGRVQRVTIEDNSSKPYVFAVNFADQDKKGDNYYVNPYTKEILGYGKSPSSEFFMTVFKLHRFLLLDSAIGRPIVGIATLIFIVLSLTGIFLWFPKKFKGWKSLKRGFKIKFSANWKRVNHDLHNTLGFYTLLVVLVMAVTGLCWSFEWYRAALSEVLGVKVFGGRSEVKPESTQSAGTSISYAEALALAEKELPYRGKTIISAPKDEKGSFEIQKNDARRWNETAFDRIFADQYSAVVLKKEIFADKKWGDQFASQIKAIHLGEIYGMFSKILYFIVCLIASSLPITGLFIWLNKMKKAPKKKIV